MNSRSCFFACLFLAALLAACEPSKSSSAGHPKELRLSLPGDPKSFDPLMSTEENGELIRYITGGVLVRVNRSTFNVEPVLAESWAIGEGSRSITFHLRSNLKFSDGQPLTARDVQRTLLSAFDSKRPSPAGEAFRSPDGFPEVTVASDAELRIRYKNPKPDLDRLFDELAIVPPPRNPAGSSFPPTAGPFAIAEYKPASYIRLIRNPYFKPQPLLPSIYFEIQSNREIEISEFLKGDLHLINNLEPTHFEQLKASMPAAALDLGPSLGEDFMWFNQTPSAQLPEWKQKWFRSASFRHAISSAIHRDDISRIVYKGLAHPAAGPFSPANQFWFNHALVPRSFDAKAVAGSLAADGFVNRGGSLYDAGGHFVEFSLITNAGNKPREQVATVIQDDLKKIGIRVNVVLIDHRSLIDRIQNTKNYEACLLGFANVDLDPVQQNNVWLSSSALHAWQPKQTTPATPWEAEIDRLTLAQSAEVDRTIRKKLFDRVQQIVYDQEPIIYLVNRDLLAAIAPAVHGIAPVPISPNLLWNVEHLSLD